MSLVCVPTRGDFFPKTRRGHGTTHPSARFDRRGGTKIREANPCVDPTCSLNAPKSKNQHIDKGANLKDWCEERGLRLKHREPVAAMLEATGA